MLEYLWVGQRIALYLARTSPQQTIDHLAYEVSQQVGRADVPPSNPPARFPSSAMTQHPLPTALTSSATPLDPSCPRL